MTAIPINHDGLVTKENQKFPTVHYELSWMQLNYLLRSLSNALSNSSGFTGFSM